MKTDLKQLAREFAEEMILYPSFTVMELDEFASDRDYNLSDDDMAEVIISTNKNMLEAYRLWKEHR